MGAVMTATCGTRDGAICASPTPRACAFALTASMPGTIYCAHMQHTRDRIVDLNQLSIAVDLGSYTCSMLYWGYLGQSWWRNHLHMHLFYEACYAFAGRGVFRINGQEHAIGAGDLFVARPSEQHEIISSEEEPLGICFWAYTLTAEPNAHRAASEEQREVDALIESFSQARWSVSRRCEALLPTLDLIAHEGATAPPGYRSTIRALTAKLILDTARAGVEAERAAPDLKMVSRLPAHPAAQRIVQYLIDNYSQPITIRDIAARMHLSERHTSRLFHAVMGVSIMDYLTMIRINAASQLLVGSTATVKQIGELSGFPDVRYFTTVFRRHTGLTPAAFRKRGGTRFMDEDGPRHVQPGRD